MKIAFIFPGQGESHSVGMAKDFYDQFPIAKQTFDQASQILGYDLTKLIFEGPLDKLSETRYCQVAIYVVSVAILRVLKEQFPDLKPDASLGLSLGEYSAATAAGVISFAQGVELVHARGSLMQQACDENPSTMAVVLGFDEERVRAVIKEANLEKDVWVANLNCPGQIVVSGSHPGIEAFVKAGKEAGAKRVLPLNVAGAFHSQLMQSAADQLEKKLSEMDIKAPICDFLMNVNASREQNVQKIKENLIQQITHSVRWQESIEKLKSEGFTHFIEIGCGKVLSGLNKRMGLSEQTLCVNCVEDLQLIQNQMTTSHV